MIPGLNSIAAKIAAGACVALLLALTVVWMLYKAETRSHDRTRAALAHAEAEVQLLHKDVELRDILAAERNADNTAVAQAEKDLIDEIREVPDSVPDAVRVQLGCARLRRAGRLDADLPAACRTDG